MKKHLVFLAILLIATGTPSFAADSGGTTICIQGFGSREDYVKVFRDSFMAEAAAAGFTVTDKFDFKYADYGIRFDLTPNANVSGKQFLFKVDLIRIKDLETVVTATYLFSELEEMVPYLQYLFFRLVANIPEYRSASESVAWKNKWLYLRLSFDYPLTFYELHNDGLIGNAGLYAGDFDNPSNVMPLDNRVNALPGATLGLEYQFLNWMSVEPVARASIEEMFGKNYVTLTAELELKFPIKIRYFMIEPYGVFSYPILVPDKVEEFPLYSVGGGLQVCIKGGPSGAFFVDVNFVHPLWGDTVIKNPYGELYPNPPMIHYRRFVVGLGVGYKLGFKDRK